MRGLIATLDWSFSMGRDWGSPEIPEKVDLKAMVRLAPKVATKPRWLWQFGQQFRQTGKLPDLTAPNLAAPGETTGPTFFGAYYEWMTTPPPTPKSPPQMPATSPIPTNSRFTPPPDSSVAVA